MGWRVIGDLSPEVLHNLSRPPGPPTLVDMEAITFPWRLLGRSVGDLMKLRTTSRGLMCFAPDSGATLYEPLKEVDG